MLTVAAMENQTLSCILLKRAAEHQTPQSQWQWAYQSCDVLLRGDRSWFQSQEIVLLSWSPYVDKRSKTISETISFSNHLAVVNKGGAASSASV